MAAPRLHPDSPSAAARGEVELVADGAHFRRVVLGGILQARTSLDIATADFKAMLVPVEEAGGSGSLAAPRGRSSRRGSDAISIVEVLRRLVDAGVEIRLLHAGVPSSAALRELREGVPQGLTIRRCPRLHAKAVIVDCQRMYLGSANLTGAGLGAKGEGKRNFELGIWTRTTGLIDAVLEHFNALWEGRHCKGCRRKDVCPVPLEEPELE